MSILKRNTNEQILQIVFGEDCTLFDSIHYEKSNPSVTVHNQTAIFDWNTDLSLDVYITFRIAHILKEMKINHLVFKNKEVHISELTKSIKITCTNKAIVCDVSGRHDWTLCAKTVFGVYVYGDSKFPDKVYCENYYDFSPIDNKRAHIYCHNFYPETYYDEWNEALVKQIFHKADIKNISFRQFCEMNGQRIWRPTNTEIKDWHSYPEIMISLI